MMGAPADEPGRTDPEGPVHRVFIRQPFAVGAFEVTVAEWRACVADDGCPEVEAIGSQTDCETCPVTGVNWHDAQSYLVWLRQKTKAPYRLLTEAQWEYAARASTDTARYWGASTNGACQHENLFNISGVQTGGGANNQDSCDDGFAQAAPVGSFSTNGFGLHDMLGNVSEWVEDCWFEGYAGAPVDGNARTRSLRTSRPEPYTPWPEGDCSLRVNRGGTWLTPADQARSASRVGKDARTRAPALGFRVARILR